MLRLLRKTFGTIALIWLALWLVGLIVFAIAPKAVNAAFPDLIRFNYVGVPASLFWAVLKVISALKASRAEPPISLAVSDLPADAPDGVVLNPDRVAPLPQTQPVYPSSLSPPSKPDVYTYSAPGLPMCPLCGERPAIFYCLTHRQAACLQCVAKHDQATECFYVPAFRAPRSSAGRGANTETRKPAESS